MIKKSLFALSSQPTDPWLEKCFTPHPMPCPDCLSTRVISICWVDDLRSIHDHGCHTQARVWHPPCPLRDHPGIPSCCSVPHRPTSPTEIPVRPGPVVGVVRLLLQFDGLRARVLQVMTRSIMKDPAVVDFPEGIVEAFTAAFHIVPATGLVLLSLCPLVHRSIRFGAKSMSPSEFSFCKLAHVSSNVAPAKR